MRKFNMLAAISVLGIAATAAGSDYGSFQQESPPEPKETPSQKSKCLGLAEEKRRLNQGQKKYYYTDNQYVWARSQKMADKKAAKKGWIKTKNLEK